MSNNFYPDQARIFVKPDLGPKPKPFEFLHFDIQITLRQQFGDGHCNALIESFNKKKTFQRSDVCADFSSKYDVFTSLFNN